MRSVDRCLHAELGEEEQRIGKDGRWTSASGRIASFAAPFVAGASLGKTLDVAISFHDAACLHIVRAAASRDFTATSPIGSVSMKEQGEVTTLACPDGREVRFTEDDALSCGVSEPEIERRLPGLSISDEADPRATRLRLSGGAVAAFACVAR